MRARGQAYETIGAFEQARADYERTLEIAQQTQDGIMEWQSLLDIGCLWAGRDYAQAGDWFRRSLDRAQALADPKLHARSLNRVGNWLVNTGRAEEGLHAAIVPHRDGLVIDRQRATIRPCRVPIDEVKNTGCTLRLELTFHKGSKRADTRMAYDYEL